MGALLIHGVSIRLTTCVYWTSAQWAHVHFFNPHPVVKKILTHVEMRGPHGPR